MNKRSRVTVLEALLVVVLLVSACAQPTPVAKPTEPPKAAAPTVAPAATTVPATKAPAPTAVPPTAAPKAAAKQVLRIGQVGNIVSLEPYRNATPNYLFLENVFDQLLVNVKNEGLQPEAAEAWELAPDNLSVKIKLRAGLTTHDGSAVDAAMLKWSIEERMTKADKGVAMYQALAPYYDKVEVVDNLTLVLRFKKPAPHAGDLLALMAVTDPDMFTKKDGTVALANAEDKQIGTGPFRMIEYVPGSHMYLERFDGYWEKGFPKLDRVEIRIFGDNASMLAALEAGDIDMAFRPAYADAARLKSNPKFTVWVPNTSGLAAILMVNPIKEQLRDVRIRQAINLAIDREAINKVAYSGMGRATAVAVPPSSIAYAPDLELKTTGDVDKAKALLKEAGATNVKVAICYEASDTTAKLTAEVIAASLQAAGFNATLDPTETAVYTQRRTSQNFELLLSVVAGTNKHPAGVEDSFVFIHTDNVFFKGIEPQKEYLDYSKAFDEAMAAKTQAEAKDAWQRAFRAIRDGAWVDVLVAIPYLSVTSARVTGLTWTEADKPILKGVTLTP